MIDKSLDELKDLADSLNVQYHPSIGRDKLIEKLEAATNPEVVEEKSTEKVAVAKTPEQLKKESLALRRIMITCMNPLKKEWQGELFCAGNGVIGMHKKYVPYGVEWHVPEIIYKMIKARKFQTFVKRRVPTSNGFTEIREGKMVPEFSINELPALGQKELKELAQRQSMAAGTAESV